MYILHTSQCIDISIHIYTRVRPSTWCPLVLHFRFAAWNWAGLLNQRDPINRRLPPGPAVCSNQLRVTWQRQISDAWGPLLGRPTCSKRSSNAYIKTLATARSHIGVLASMAASAGPGVDRVTGSHSIRRCSSSGQGLSLRTRVVLACRADLRYGGPTTSGAFSPCSWACGFGSHFL